MVDYTPYAQALFELAQDSKQEMAWMSELKQVAQVITSVPELSKILAHPSIPRVKKKEIIQTAFESELDTTVFRFLLVLNEHNEQLISNYKKLEDLYKLKEKELEEAKQEAKKSKRYNTIMMIISVVSMMIAAAAWLLPNILGGVS